MRAARLARQSQTEQSKLFKTNHHSAFYYTANYMLIYPINYMLEISENKWLVIFFYGETFQRLRMAHAVPGAIICSNYDISIICANCYLFNWHQPEDLTTVRKCTGCRVVAYCGKECQVSY